MSRLMWRLRSLVESVRRGCVSSYSTFTPKDFQYEDHSHSGTLLNRFTKSIAIQNCQEAKIVKNSIKYSQFYPVQNHDKFFQELQKVESDQLSRLLMFTANYRGNADIMKLFRVINQLDNEVDGRIAMLEYRDVQELMVMFFYLLPNKFTQLDSARRGVQKLIDEFSRNDTKDNFLQVCFYLGLFKKSRQHSEQLKAFLGLHLMKYLDDLSSLQLALVANSAFKTSVIIPNQEFHQRLITEICNMDETVDIQLLVTFVKSLRHNKVDCRDVLPKVQHLLEEGDIPDADLRGFAHLLALFVENRRIPATFEQSIVPDCMEIIREEHEKSMFLSREDRYVNPNFRPKDLATFLWCCTSFPDKTLSRDDLNAAGNAVLWKLRNYEYKYQYDEFVDTLLSLFMLGAKSEALFKAFFSEKDFLVPSKNPNRVKLDSRQTLLISCLEIEAPQVLPKEMSDKSVKTPANPPSYLLEKRPLFTSIGQMLKDMADEFNFTRIDPKIAVKNINIPSYLIEMKTAEGRNVSFWMEFLDKHTTMADKVTPTAIFRLKMRLLRSLEQDFILVNTCDKNGEELRVCLKKAIKEHLETLDSESEDEIQGVIK